MNEQPKALRIAEWFEGGYGGCEYEAAAELRRLHALNQELLEALQGLLGMPDYDGTAETSRLRLNHKHAAWAAIAKATGETR